VTTVEEPRVNPPYHLLWTGREVLVWGRGLPGASDRGAREIMDAGRYDPERDGWLTVSGVGAPLLMICGAAWTGSEMIVYGASGDGKPAGARYDPLADTWRTMSLDGAPAAGSNIHTFWTGRALLVWGNGVESGRPGSGAAYDPVSDVWRPIARDPILNETTDLAIVWTGTDLLAWSLRARAGARYDPAANRWRLMPDTRAPRTRVKATAVWAGRRLVVWGGLPPVFPQNVPPNTNVDPTPDNLEHGTAYDPTTDSWQALPELGRRTPSPISWRGRNNHLAVSTGSDMIVWGGQNDGYHGSERNDGARWHPFT
jgi:hypothetical protein